jgi:hypothetical protein
MPGLCGCITTLSSWMNGTVNDKLRSSNWLKFALLIFLEFWMTWSAFTMGFALARMNREISNLPRIFLSLNRYTHTYILYIHTYCRYIHTYMLTYVYTNQFTYIHIIYRFHCLLYMPTCHSCYYLLIQHLSFYFSA